MRENAFGVCDINYFLLHHCLLFQLKQRRQAKPIFCRALEDKYWFACEQPSSSPGVLRTEYYLCFAYTQNVLPFPVSLFHMPSLSHLVLMLFGLLNCRFLMHPLPAVCLALDQWSLLATLLWKHGKVSFSYKTQSDRKTRTSKQKPFQTISILYQRLLI